MENKAHALAAGLFVLLATALLAGLATWLTRDQGQYDVYEVSTREAVAGLQSQAPVRYRGVNVGKVADIRFDPSNRGNVLLRLLVDQSAPMNKSTFATLSYQGVTGLAFVQLDDAGAASEALQTNSETPTRIPMRPALLGQLAERGQSILDKVDEVAARASDTLSPDNQKRLARVLDDASLAAQSVTALSTRMQTVLDAQLGPDRVNIPAFVREASTTLKTLQSTTEKAGKAVDEAAATARQLTAKDGALERIGESASALSSAADAFSASTLPRVNQASDDTARAAKQLGRAANAVSDNPQLLLFGNGALKPGPGEPGFAAPGAKP